MLTLSLPLIDQSLLEAAIEEIAAVEQTLFVCPMTGAKTRYWLQMERRQLSKRRYVIAADVRGLKKINDAQGTEAGDRHIKQMYDRLCAQYRRQSDVIGRRNASGDEFLIFTDRCPDNLSIDGWAIGWAEIQGDIDAAIAAADLQMYKNKKVKSNASN